MTDDPDRSAPTPAELADAAQAIARYNARRRLAIADPPYLGRAEMFYGDRQVTPMNANATARIGPVRKADRHPDAVIWDDPDTHRALVERLVADYDGWVIALASDNLFDYLQWVPRRTNIAVWHDPGKMPNGCHPRRRWEAVLVLVPEGRRRISQIPAPHVGDVLTATHSTIGFVGAKPRAWTRWALNMLGYTDGDTVDDLFPGSGAVQRELNQQTFAWSDDG